MILEDIDFLKGHNMLLIKPVQQQIRKKGSINAHYWIDTYINAVSPPHFLAKILINIRQNDDEASPDQRRRIVIMVISTKPQF